MICKCDIDEETLDILVENHNCPTHSTKYIVQRKLISGWVNVSIAYHCLLDAENEALTVDIGNVPQALRIVDNKEQVQKWVSRNGYKSIAEKENK